MNVKLIKLSKNYYKQLQEMIDEWKIDQETNHTNHSPYAIFKSFLVIRFSNFITE